MSKGKIFLVKKLYGEKPYKENHSEKYGDEIIHGWVMLGYPSIQKLEVTFSDTEILELYKKQDR